MANTKSKTPGTDLQELVNQTVTDLRNALVLVGSAGQDKINPIIARLEAASNVSGGTADAPASGDHSGEAPVVPLPLTGTDPNATAQATNTPLATEAGKVASTESAKATAAESAESAKTQSKQATKDTAKDTKK